MRGENRSQTTPERTEEERERARQERERRRLAKQGEAVPPLPPPEQRVSETPPSRPSAPEQPMEEARSLQLPAPEQRSSETQSSDQRQPEPPDTDRQSPQRLSPPRAAPTSARRLHGLHVNRPHLHRPRRSRVRRGAVRVTTLLVLVGAIGLLIAVVVLLRHHGKASKLPPAPVIVKVVIPEGDTRAQIAAIAHADGLTGNYLAASVRSAQLNPVSYGAPRSTPDLEGFLFPATYEMYVGAPVTQLVSEQLAAFKENFGGGEVHRAKLLGITPYQLLSVASMIEREAELAHDRPLVSAVIYNRLRLNMALGIDATLRYALNDFTHPLTEAELHDNSPYNTRTHKGLPPTPISNPGVAAIEAADRPAHVSYLYYVAGADGCGELVFSTGFAEFEKNAAAYNEAISRNGGHVPICKKK